MRSFLKPQLSLSSKLPVKKNVSSNVGSFFHTLSKTIYNL